MSLSIEQLRELSSQITQNPDSIYDLDPEKAAAMRKYLHPLGNIISTKKSYVNLGIVNWREKYLRRLHMTALVGYLYRTLEEYEPDNEIAKEVNRFTEACKAAPPDQHPMLKHEHDQRVALIKSTAKGIISQFLNRNFNYNPDKHLRAAHSDNKSDPDRRSKDQVIRETCGVEAAAQDIDHKLESKPEQTYKYLRSMLLTTYAAAQEATSALNNILGVILNPQINCDDKHGILFKKYKQLLDITADMQKIAKPMAQAGALDTWKIDPPVDVFHQFDRYLTNHYEQLRDVVDSLYNEKSDFEFGVILYDVFKTEEAAREYKIQHESEFRTEIVTIETGAVSLLGPFKENRQRVDFYNKHTEIMKRMMEQVEADHKLGKDLMEKQLRDAKKKNISEAGPDEPGLAEYTKAMRVVQELGAAGRILSKEDKDKLAEAVATAKAVKEDYEVPDDGIQVDMFFPEKTDSGVTLKKTKFYTQAEAPLHLQEGSPFAGKYQPVRAPGESLDDAYTTKVIKGRNGKKMEVRVPKKTGSEATPLSQSDTSRLSQSHV
jgi:hypothetical protein